MPRAISGQPDDTASPKRRAKPNAVPDVARAIRRARRRWRARQNKPVLPNPRHRRRRIIRGLWRSPLLRVVVAVVVAANVRGRYSELLDRRAAWGESVRVPVMARSRPVGSVLRASDIEWRRVPRSAVSVSTPPLVGDVVGRRLVTSVAAGEFVTPTRLSRGPSSSLRARIGEGRYAVTISMRENRPRVSVGDEVDVIDASGNPASTRSVVVQTDPDAITLSVRSDDLQSLSAAMAGPLLVAVRGEEPTV